MTSTAPAQRDTRIDVFRALVLLTIFVNHVPGTIFEYFTHKNFGFSDSAEAFVLISGVAVGLAYGMTFHQGNRLRIILKSWRRAGVLYVTHIVTTVVTLAIFSAAALHFSRPDLLKLINIQMIIEDTPEALLGIATLGHQIGYNNILSMYAVVLLMMPFFLWIGTFSLRLMMVMSALLWLIAGIFQIAPTNYPGAGFWFLNPLSWQFLFVIGTAGILHVKGGGEVRFNWLMASTAVGYLVGALIWVRVPLWGIETASSLPAVLTGFDKTFLSLSRLMHILAIAYLIVVIPALSKLAKTGPNHPLAVLGRHALPVFVAGTILAMVAQTMKAVSPGGLLYDAILISTGIALQFGLAYYLEWLPRIGWGGKKKLQPVAASASAAAPQARVMDRNGNRPHSNRV